MTVLGEARPGLSCVLRLDTAPTGMLTAKLCSHLERAFSAALADPDIRTIVLTSVTPGIFVRHFDVATIVRSAEALQRGEVDGAAFPDSPVFRLFQSIATSSKPVIAAINGTCMGGGFELALCCTLRIANSDVREIGLPETRIGLFPGGGGTQRLPRLIGEARALAFILQGTVVDAEGALALGLVHEVVDDAFARATMLADEFNRMSVPLLAATLNLVRAASDTPIAEGARAEALAFAALLRDDPNALAGMRDFLKSGQGLGAYGQPLKN